MSLIEQSPDPATILERYADGSIQLEAAIASLNEADLDTALDEKSWTIRQIVHHIVDGDDIWRIFVKMTLGSSEAVFRLQWYLELPQMRWAESWAHAERAIEPYCNQWA